MKKGKTGWKIALMVAMLATALFAKNEFLYRVLWEQGSMMRNPTYFKELVTKAAGYGYNTVIFVDYDLNKIEKQSAKFFAKYKDVMSHAKRHNIELAPWTLWQGFPAIEDYNLSESFPVRNTKFMVSGKEARAVGDHDVGLKNGGFESGVSGWSMGALTNANYHLDKVAKKSGTASLCVKNAPAGARLVQQIKLKPGRAYQISAWIKTQGLKDPGRVVFYVDPHLLARYDRPFGTPRGAAFSGTQSWRKCVTDFNSLKESSATLTLWLAKGVPQGGNMWIDDVQVREVGLYETMRGKSRPLVVKNADGSKTYQEGKDYVVDPKCNSMTLETYDYEGHLKIPAGSAIQDKQELRVDWFQYANVRTIVAASDFCLPKTWDALEDNVERIDNLMGTANAVYSKYSEYRIGAWNQDCECFSFKTGGEYLARTLERSECMLRSTGNGCRTIFSENDMYDPYFNGYNGPYGTWYAPGPRKVSPYGVYGGTYGSHEGLSKDIIIINWNTPFGPAYTDSSLMFFAGKDPKYPREQNRQLLQCLAAGDASRWCNTLDKLEKKGLDGVSGVSFTDWYSGTYTHMGAVANAFRARGRWGTNPFPNKTCAPSCKVAIAEESNNAPVSAKMLSATATKTSANMLSIQYSVPAYAHVSIKAFDLMGREVQTLVNAKTEIGTHRALWNTRALPAGMYIIRLNVEGVGRQTLKEIVF